MSVGVLLGTFMGGMCLGSLLLPRVVVAAASSAARVRGARARHRRLRPRRCSSRCRSSAALYPAWGGEGVAGFLLRGARRGRLPAAADARDGRDAAGRVALGRDHAGGRVVARVLLCGEHRRRRLRIASRPASICCASTTCASATFVAVGLNVDRRRTWRWLAARCTSSRQPDASVTASRRRRSDAG